MAEPIRVSTDVRIPAAALSFRAVRSSGPGGQNVNKVSSKVELRVDLDRIVGLTEAARARLEALTVGSRTVDGLLLIISQRTRDQHRNREDAREKVRRLVARALIPPRPRRPTQPTQASRERRLAAKRHQAARKRDRARVRGED
jgi:ribosome-associated protein